MARTRLVIPAAPTITYPPELPVRLRVFWDKVETDLAALDQFRSEYSRWLYR